MRLAEAGHLREDEPHPVAALGPGPQLAQRLVVHTAVLGPDEPLEVEGVLAHRGRVRRVAVPGKSRPARVTAGGRRRPGWR